jgi:hypothetical protein
MQRQTLSLHRLKDYVDVVESPSTGTWTRGGVPYTNYVNIERLSGPATIAASESVVMVRSGTGGQSVPNGVDSVPVGLVGQVIDTHGIWRAGTGYNSVTGTWTTNPRAVIPVSGEYVVNFCLGITVPNTVNGQLWSQVRLFRNGSVIDGFAGSRFLYNNATGFTQDVSSSGSGTFKCFAGDELVVEIYQANSSEL